MFIQKLALIVASASSFAVTTFALPQQPCDGCGGPYPAMDALHLAYPDPISIPDALIKSIGSCNFVKNQAYIAEPGRPTQPPKPTVQNFNFLTNEVNWVQAKKGSTCVPFENKSRHGVWYFYPMDALSCGKDGHVSLNTRTASGTCVFNGFTVKVGEFQKGAKEYDALFFYPGRRPEDPWH